MPAYDFDFQRYVARRKGAREAQVREGAAYAFPGDVRLLRTLDRLRPVQLALEETARLWRAVARAELLGTAVRAGTEHYPSVAQAAARCAQRLHIEVPTVYITPQPASQGARTLGTSEDAYIVVAAGLLEGLSGDELLDVIGRECGRIQNGHVPFLTALYYLTTSASDFVRWMVLPATLTLSAWERRAVITADRAGLLCSRSLEVSLSALRKSVMGDEATVSRRARALSRFAGSAYYRTVIGLDPSAGEPQEACDAAVARILDDKDGETEPR
ncbi:MAG: M48 family metalloprotease [Myxococcales bacterium]|nr:M48 family metalloprotease [Myxococcales bacterium]